MQTELNVKKMSRSQVFVILLISTGLFLLIGYIFMAVQKSYRISESLLNDSYCMELQLSSPEESGTDDFPEGNTGEKLEEILRVMERGILGYQMVFSHEGRDASDDLSLVLAQKLAPGENPITLTEEENLRILKDIHIIRQAVFRLSDERQRAISILFILLLSIVIVIFFLLSRAVMQMRSQKEEYLHHRELSAKIAEQENRIANLLSSELHDDIGQMLVFIKMGLKEEEQELGKDIDAILDKVRGLSHKLMLPRFQGGNLPLEIEKLLSRFSAVSSLMIQHTISEFHDHRYPEHYPMLIYRLLQECLQNTLKHSQADSVKLVLMESAPFLLFRYSDNGVGFQKEDSVELESIKERALLLNTELQIENPREPGIRLLLKIPFAGETV